MEKGGLSTQFATIIRSFYSDDLASDDCGELFFIASAFAGMPEFVYVQAIDFEIRIHGHMAYSRLSWSGLCFEVERGSAGAD